MDPAGAIDAPTGARARLLTEAAPPVRTRVAELVATAVGHLPEADVPAAVRPVARFTPSKRARFGAGPLLSALADDEAFAERVVGWWRENRPAEWDAASDADPLHAAAVAVVEGRDEDAALVRDVGERTETARLRAELTAARARAERLTGELADARAERDAARASARAEAPDASGEAAKLRARLREQGVRVRRAEDAAAEARARLDAGQADVLAEVGDLRRERDRLREHADAAEHRARQAAAELDAARRAAQEARRADEARLALLLDTLAGAATGLRRELGLGTSPGAPGAGAGASLPADLVGRTQPVVGRPAVDVATLDRLLGLPEVHLLLDGYNVTKTAWPALALATQRERLVAALVPLAARTGAETTVVFDGAGVVGVPTLSGRGVRVLFSEAGDIADDLIRRLVAAEPHGRPLVVVTSDRAVVESVRRDGAHPVPSAVLLERLARI